MSTAEPSGRRVRLTCRRATCRPRTGAGAGRRGARALPVGRGRPELAGLPGAGEGAARAVRHLRRRRHGNVYAVGDAEHEFSIMSVSKPFVFALVCQALGAERGARSGSASTPPGCRSTRSTAIERSADGRTNPMVNCGRHRHDQPGAGREPRGASGGSSTRACRASPAARCRSTTRSMPRRRRPTSATRASPGCCRATAGSTCDPAEATDLYTRQCSLNVSARDLAVMGATLADGGVNPLTRERVVDADSLPARAGRDGDRRPVRDLRRLAVRHRAAGQERHRRRHRHRLARQGRARHVRAAARRGRQQRQGPAGRRGSCRERLGLDLFASQPEA